MNNIINSVESRRISSNEILDSLNRLYDSKLTGTTTQNEFSNIILSVWSLFVNKIKQGKVSSNEIESMEALLPGISGKKCFKINHEGLFEATNTAKRQVYAALVSQESMLNQQVYGEENNFKRIK